MDPSLRKKKLKSDVDKTALSEKLKFLVVSIKLKTVSLICPLLFFLLMEILHELKNAGLNFV